MASRVSALDTAGFQADLRIAVQPVIAALAAAAVVIAFVSEALSFRTDATPTVVFILALATLAWAADHWHPLAGRWATVAAVIITFELISYWLATPASLALRAIAAALAAGLIGVRAAVAVALAETILLFAQPAVARGPDRALVLALIWIIVTILAAIYGLVHRLVEWSWGYYQEAKNLLEEVGRRRVDFKRALDDLARVNRQLAATNEKLAAARLAAEEAQRTKATFVANVSHEFRTPLNMIIGLTDLLLETPEVYGRELPPALVEDLAIVQRNCEHLSGMIDDVLDLSQVEAGRLSLHKERVSLVEVIERALAVVRPLLAKKGLGLEVALPEQLPEIYCDRTRIRQVVVNLLSNAARFTERGGIAVHAAREGQDVVVSVRDTGPGIPPEEAARIFEPFYQASRVSRQRDGSGLGLSISKQFVELHDGRMWVESQLGVGSTFHFRLPISPPIGPIAKPERWIAEGWTWVERTSPSDLPLAPTRPRMVICDETGDLYPLLARHCDEVEFVDTRDLARAGEEAQRCAAQAVLLNVPQAGDLTALVEKARAAVRDTPIIGCCIPARAEHALGAGAMGYLTKPVTGAQLRELMQQIGRPLRRVLVVDDDSDTLRLFARLLQAYDPSLEVATAATGQEALAELRARPSDLVLLDIALPDMEGWQILQLKSRDEALRDIPVIIVSARDPRQQPAESSMLVATLGEGLSITQVLRCSRALPALLLQPG